MAQANQRNGSYGLREKLLACIDGELDAYTRAEAIDRFTRQFGTPIPVSDEEIILSATVELGRGIGAEPNGWWVEERTSIITCPECGSFGARESVKANAGQHYCQSVECRACGYDEVHV